MKLKSRGLGRKELIMDFREYEVTREGDEVLVTGTIKKPVHWDFSIRMSPDDIPGMLKVALSPATIGMFFRWLNPFKKTKVDEDAAGASTDKPAASSARTSAAASARSADGESEEADAEVAETAGEADPNSRAAKKAAKAAAKAEKKASKSDEEGTAA
ncbi:MAG: hypothetical protein DCC49_11785 [Acidobacteria bacterium]|nr:MAG: hypothetical protein DCC49_11785 [Acidobacteriota bacterium]